MWIVIIIFIIVLIIGFSGKKREANFHTKYPTKKNDGRAKPVITIRIGNVTRTYDSSTIDVTGRSYKIESSLPGLVLKKYAPGVPYWQHHYVYSYSEIHTATSSQQSFYKILKESFFKGDYLDLEGNTNYAFILFFNLLDDFLVHKDLDKIEGQLEVLGKCYSKTSTYVTRELIKRLELIGDETAIERFREKQQNQYHSYYNDYESWKLGSKFKTKLKLKESEVSLLNKIWQPYNNFGKNEYCCIEIVRLFLKTMEALASQYQQEGSTIENQFDAIADIVAKKHFNYRANSTNYKYSIDQTKDQLYSAIFKFCENTVRESYNHKRKLSVDFYNSNGIVQQEFNVRVGSKVNEIHSKLISGISPPDESTEIELNAQSTSRWKIKFDKVTEDFKGDSKSFIEEMRILGAQNIKNPAIENIYFEASKFIAKTDKQASLLFYINYLYSDLQSSKFDNKQLTKTVQKNLFTSNEQLSEFEKIVTDLISTRDLNKALQAASHFYVPKRKKIKLDSDAIAEAHQKHSGTVELLNEYLQDENESSNKTTNSEVDTEEVQIEIQKEESKTPRKASRFTDAQVELLEAFQKSGLTLSEEEIELFAKSRGLFKNSLIEGINDTCYETLDDVLIEEEDGDFSINSDYFQRILTL